MSYKEANARFMNHKIYISPVEHENPQPVIQSRRSSCSLIQNILCLIGISILLIYGGRCIHRAFVKNTTTSVNRSESFSLSEGLKEFAQLSDELLNYSEELFNEFETFLKTYKKKYSSLREQWNRFTIFAKNVKEIKEQQKLSNSTIFEALWFADQSEDEMKKMIMPYEEPQALDVPKFDTSPGWAPILQRPASFDWRAKGAVMGIKNQQQCGSCWAFASVAVVESLNIIKGGKRTTLSEQELIDCDNKNRGCFGGFRPYAFQFVKSNGLVSDNGYKYTGVKEQCHLPSNDSRIFVDEVYSFDKSEDDMADWVATKGPITIGVNVTKEMFSYRSGVFNPTPSDCAYKSMGSHVLAVVGYGTQNGEDYWLLKNSWGVWHGESGYIRMKRGVNSCGIGNAAYTALITKPH